MEETKLIALDEAERITHKFLAGRIRNLRGVGITKTKLTSVLEMLLYEVEGTYERKAGFLSSAKRTPFKIQVNARDGTVVGFEG